jgi:hypothetical protein
MMALELFAPRVHKEVDMRTNWEIMLQVARALSCCLVLGCAASSAAGGSGGGVPDGRVPDGGAPDSRVPDSGPFDSGSGQAGTGGSSAIDGAFGDGSACASVSITATPEVTPGNILVLFDPSLTMGDPWRDSSGTNMPKHAVASSALLGAINPLLAQVNLGAIFFPTTAATSLLNLCPADVAPITAAPPQIAISPGATFAGSWTQHFAPPWALLLGTPLNKALQRADVALRDPALQGTTVVIIVTDGQWTCEDGSEMTTVAALFARGIRTYIVGLPGANGATGLDTLARAGGTADPACTANCFLLPTDAQQLEAQLATIAMTTAGFDSCTLTLRGRIVDRGMACTAGRVSLDGVDVPCDPQNGFSIDDETHLTLHGAACDTLTTSAASIDASFPCNVVVLE